MWVFDATPLIYLAKVERLTLIESLERDCVVPRPVHEEVVTDGLDAGHPDARRVGGMVDTDAVAVVSVPETPLHARLLDNDSLSRADVAVLACADANDGTAVMDEQYGRDVAAAEGVSTRGTAFLVLTRLKAGVIDAEETRATVDAMIDAGWYCAPDVYTRIVGEIERISE